MPVGTGDARVVAIDVGGTKLAGALVDGGGRVSAHRTRPTRPAGPDGEDLVWPELAALVDELRAEATGEVLGVGIGSAGPLDLARGTASPVNIPTWRRYPLVERLREHTGLPVRLAGDGLCAAIGEHWLGAARGMDDAIVIVVSTGVGGGIIQRGRLVAGRTGNAGHIGHMPVDFDGPRCACGSRGCVEAIASGPSMVAWAREQGWTGTGGGVELAAAARGGDGIAGAAFTRGSRALAAGITAIGVACDLADAVIGGGVAQAADVLLPRLTEALRTYAHLDFVADLKLHLAALGNGAGLAGAAALILDPERYPTA